MKIQDVENTWTGYNRKLDSGINLNAEALHRMQFGKARSTLLKLLVRRIIESAVFVLLIVLLLKFILANYPVVEYVVAGLVLAVFAIIGLVGGLRQILLIRKLDYSTPVTAFQAEMEKLKAYSLQTLKLLFLSVPFYFAYLIIGFKSLFGMDVFLAAEPKWLVANLCLSIVLVPVSIWFVGRLDYRSGSNWVKRLIRDNGGREIHASLDFLSELEKFRSEGAGSA